MNEKFNYDDITTDEFKDMLQTMSPEEAASIAADLKAERKQLNGLTQLEATSASTVPGAEEPTPIEEGLASPEQRLRRDDQEIRVTSTEGRIAHRAVLSAMIDLQFPAQTTQESEASES